MKTLFNCHAMLKIAPQNIMIFTIYSQREIAAKQLIKESP